MNKNSLSIGILLYIGVLSAYLLLVAWANFPTTIYNYFSHFAYAVTYGSLALVTQPSSTLDLIPFGTQTYIFAPPSPVLLVSPFIFLFGLQVPDTVYTAIIGAVNPVLLYFVILKFSEIFSVSVTRRTALLLAIFYAFGTSHFYESIIGGVWHTGQIITQTYFLASLLCLFYYLQHARRVALLGFVLFFFLAILGRNQFLLAAPILIGLIFLAKTPPKKPAIGVVIASLSAIVANGLYNLARFHSFFENGFIYHNYNVYFAQLIESHGLFSPIFVPINLYYHFLHPLAIDVNLPYIFKADQMGNSIFFVSPLFICLFVLLFQWKKFREFRWIIFALLLGAIAVYLPALFQFSTGWRQFGARYLLESTPFLILLLVLVTEHISKPILLLLVSLSIYIQLHAFSIFG